MYGRREEGRRGDLAVRGNRILILRSRSSLLIVGAEALMFDVLLGKTAAGSSRR
jgi:hypothetical protein